MKKDIKRNNNEAVAVVDKVKTTIITNEETIEAIEEARRIAKEPNGWYYDLNDFLKAVYDE